MAEEAHVSVFPNGIGLLFLIVVVATVVIFSVRRTIDRSRQAALLGQIQQFHSAISEQHAAAEERNEILDALRERIGAQSRKLGKM